MKKALIIFTMLFSLLGISCQDELKIENNSIYPMGGEWWVKVYQNNTTLSDYVKIMTYNTASDDGKIMWIDDLDEIWEFKVKCPIDLSSLTFAGQGLQNVTYNSKVEIANGKILLNAVKAPSKTITDSIYFQAKFSDDKKGLTYTIAGYRKTGFLEDEHK